MIRPRLFNANDESELSQTGYVLIHQLFTEAEVNAMLDLYRCSHLTEMDPKATLWNSLYDIPTEEGLKISDKLVSIIHPKLASVLQDFKAPVAMFMSKNKGDQSECELHRDTSAFDENKYEFLNIWIPLVDCDEKNGSIYFLRGSNHFFDYPRPPALTWPYKHLTKALLPQAETVIAKAGDCVLFSGKALHGSHHNYTDQYRPVVFIGAVAPEAELLYYFYDEQNNEVRAYAVPHDFYFGKDFSEPVGKYPESLRFDYNPPKMDATEVIAGLSKYKSKVE